MWLDKLLFHSPLQRICEWNFSQSLTVLTYHTIYHATRFEEQIKYIKKKMYPLSLKDLLSSIQHGRALPKRALLITFDDGDRTIYDVAKPVLENYQLPAVVFVITQHVGSDLPFWWDETKWLVKQRAVTAKSRSLTGEALVRELKHMPNQERLELIAALRNAIGGQCFSQPQLRWDELIQLEAAGIAVGNHTHTHPPLNQVGDTELSNELITAHNKLTSALGHAPRAFAYPYGYTNSQAISILQQLGYKVGFLFDHKISGWPISNPLGISRVRVDPSNSYERFGCIISGLHPMIHHRLGRN